MSLRIAIIGSGFSGLCLGIELKKAGFADFTVYEKAEGLGGTWRENTYPGAACDSPSFAYCFSFAQKTDWSRKWAPQPEILGYLEQCADDFGLRPHLRFGTEIASARFDPLAGLWELRTSEGETIEAEVLISSVGQLNRPFVPQLPGLSDFRGPCFHSAGWDDRVPLEGRPVAVIGNAASAIQLVPRVAERASRLSIFQRSANWMMPKGDREYSEAERRRFARSPWLARLYRWWIWLSFELRWPLFRGNRWMRRNAERLSLRHMHAAVADPELREALTPDYPIGGKRIRISDDYYSTLVRDDVELVTSGIERIVEDGVVDREGRHHPAEVLVLATGFESTSFLVPMRIEGLGGRLLQDEWGDGAHAYLGISVAGFPNFFMTYGPNTNLGHNSIIFMIECQSRYILGCLEAMRARELAWIDLRPEVQEDFNLQLQEELASTVWSQTGKSWYKTDSGRITNNWSGTTLRYWWRTRRPALRCYRQVARSASRPAGSRAVAPDSVAAAGS